MGLMDFVRGELLEIIEWTDDSRNTLSYRFPDDDKAIKRGAQLIVRESQLVQFVYVGQFADRFGPGKHTLSTDNIPILTRVGELVEPEVVVGAGDLLQEERRVHDPEVVGHERPHAHDPEVGVPDHHGVRRAPPVAGEEAGQEVPRRSPGRGPPYWKSRVLRRQAHGDEDDAQGRWVPQTA